MTFTLSDCIERINQALDYPAIGYTDISHYFDQAISELNTTLRIGLKPISQLLTENEFSLNTMPNVVALDKYPTSAEADLIPRANFEPENSTYYYNTSTKKYGLKIDSVWKYYDRLYAIYSDSTTYSTHVFISAYYSDDSVMWVPYAYDALTSLDLTNYLPVDVIILFIIPYVCYKFTIRDGGNGALFREEFAQGFQQIQTSYDIPNTVHLATVAHLKAYTSDVNEHIDNLNVLVPLRAIYDSMKIGNAVMPEYGGFYESGGWGL